MKKQNWNKFYFWPKFSILYNFVPSAFNYRMSNVVSRFRLVNCELLTFKKRTDWWQNKRKAQFHIFCYFDFTNKRKHIRHFDISKYRHFEADPPPSTLWCTLIRWHLIIFMVFRTIKGACDPTKNQWIKYFKRVILTSSNGLNFENMTLNRPAQPWTSVIMPKREQIVNIFFFWTSINLCIHSKYWLKKY